jgi:hypothetical protein
MTDTTDNTKYHSETIEQIAYMKDIILQKTSALGVSAAAVAGCMAKEYNETLDYSFVKKMATRSLMNTLQ